MATELIPLKQGQHVVTYVPKVTTDLPFFNLTQRKKGISNKIKFEGKDGFGNPVNWEVRHNTDDDIGYAGVLAHEVWYLVIKPAIDAARRETGRTPSIVPLGGIRECLRMVGWTEGGHQANDFIQALTQISFAGVIADLWFPTGETDGAGKPKFQQIKGRFSRMSVYAIGEKHLTEDEVKTAAFEFELEDTVYIKLDPFEARLQEAQADSQKLIDNEYMFSVKPVARRWYELMAGKVFGTVQYKKSYFKVRYSDYLKHHHTLKRFYTFKAVNRQIRQIIKDHVETGFITKFETKKIKEPNKELDFEIKFYVGQEAKNSISRIKSYLATKTRKKQIEVKKAHISPKLVGESQNRSDIPTGAENTATSENLPPQSILISDQHLTILDLMPSASREVVQILFNDYQISWEKCYKLATEQTEECRRQIAAMPFREVELNNKAGFLIKAIEESYNLPEAYLSRIEAKKREALNKQKTNATLECKLCDHSGFRFVITENYPRGAAKRCTHDEKIENQFETIK
jgi:hypothetical protein